MAPSANVRVVRIVAALQFAMVSVGAAFLALAASVAVSPGGFHIDASDTPYVEQFFWGYTTMNVIFVAGLALSSWYLWRLRRIGLVLLWTVLGAEVLYWMVVMAFALHPRFALSAAAATGIGNMGLGAQFLCGYPLTGLIGAGILQALGVWRRTLATS
jgi:hypothetical protein